MTASSKNVGQTHVLQAEGVGLIQGLRQARRAGYVKVVEGESKTSIDCINGIMEIPWRIHVLSS